MGKTIGGNMGDFLSCVKQTADGGYILGGFSFSGKSGDKTQNRRGSASFADYWIIKLDAGGNIEWDKTIGGTRNDQCHAIVQTSDGGYIACGSSDSDISGEKTENDKGSGDYWIVKLDSKGNTQWDKTIGGNASDDPNSIQQTNDGGYIVCGYSYSGISGDKTDYNRGLSDFWVVKLDNAANIQWDKTIGGSDLDFGIAVLQIRGHGYIIGGQSQSGVSGEKTENNRGNMDYWLVRLDSAGSIKWDKTIGGRGYDNLASIQPTRDTGFIVGGTSDSKISGQKGEDSKGFNDYWIVKLNDKGKIRWDKTIGGADYEYAGIACETANDKYIIAGYSSSGISGDRTDTSRGGGDYWFVKLNDEKGSSIMKNLSQSETIIAKVNKNRNDDLIAYPNPAKNSITINFTAKEKSQCIGEITDLSGKLLLQKKINATEGINHTIFDISKFSKGVYFINLIFSNTEKYTCKFQKQ